MIKITVETDLSGAKSALEAKKKLAQYALTEQVVKDSNYYVPKQTGNLEGSSLANSNYQEGEAVWVTPYARRLYYNPGYKFSKDVNPNARGLWFEAAKAERSKNWERVVKETYK